MTAASRAGLFVVTAILAVGIAMPAKADLVKELIPTGKLRVAIAIAPAQHDRQVPRRHRRPWRGAGA
jgi:hypothetical protein